MIETDFLQYIFKEIAQRKIKTVLDICCGTGLWAIPLASKGVTVTGIDKHKKMLARAQVLVLSKEDVCRTRIT